MTDMLKTIAPKSNQLNFDDFTGGQSKTIKITKVSGIAGEQPIAVNYDGDNGKPYMPCKSMRRVLVHCWGRDGHAYVGRSMTLYGDSSVKFGGMEVGGIRISHMSDIAQSVTLALTSTKAQRKPFTVHPLVVQAAPAPDTTPAIDFAFESLLQAGRDAAGQGNASLDAWVVKVPATYKLRLRGEVGAELRKIANEVDAEGVAL